MKRKKAVWIQIFTGILLILSCVVLSKALIEECSRLNGSNSMQKVQVSVKNQIDHQGENSFTIDDIKRLKKELAIENISYTAQSGLINTSVAVKNTVIPVRLTGANHLYPMFGSMTLEAGSFVTQKQAEEGAMVTVIDYELARKIFKTTGVIGKTIDIYGVTFTIVGVVKEDGGLIGALTDDGLPDVYIPAAVMLELDATACITDLWIKTDNSGTSDQNTDKVSLALQQAGKSPANYNIRDYNLKLALMEQVPLLLVFILGIVSVLLLLAYLKNLIKKMFIIIRDGCRKDYFTNAIKNNLAVIGIYLLETAAALTGIALIWLGIRFRLYIPPQYIPDELINISYYSNLIQGIIQGGIQNLGYIAPKSELIVNTVSQLMNILFCISAILGLLLFYMGLRELKSSNADQSHLTVIFGLVFIFSLAAIAGVAYLSVLPYTLDVKSILVTWAFIYINIFRKESGTKNA